MVATRRGTRVCTDTKTPSDGPPATPSTGRRTRGTAKKEEPSAQAVQEDIIPKGDEEGPVSPKTPSCSVVKRCSKARLHSPEQPSTPQSAMGHDEADVSDLESCCSAVSDMELPITRTQRKKRQTRSVRQEEDGVSEAESHTSAVSGSKGHVSARRSTRKKNIPEHIEDEVGIELEAASQSVLRSQRKSTRTRSSAIQRTDSELSDADSCSLLGAEGSTSTTGRATRSRQRVAATPIPMHLDDVSEGSPPPGRSSQRTRAVRGKTATSVVVTDAQSCDSEGLESGPSVTPQRRRTRAVKGKTSASVVVNEAQSCDSDGFESGPSMTRVTEAQSCDSDGFESGPSMTPQKRTRSQRKVRAKASGPTAVESDSDLTDLQLGSPCSSQGKETPSSSRTSSGNSTRLSTKALSVVLKRAGLQGEKLSEQEEEPETMTPLDLDSPAGEVTATNPAEEEESALNDSKLENTVIDDPDRTVVEDNTTILEESPEEKTEEVTSSDPTCNDVAPEVIEVGHPGSVTLTADVELSESHSELPSAVLPEEDTDTAEAEKGVSIMPVEDEKTSTPADSEVAVPLTAPDAHTEEVPVATELAVSVRDQQMELSAENKDGDNSEMAEMQEMVPSTEALDFPSSQSYTVTCEMADTSEEAKENDEAMEVDEVSTHTDAQPTQPESLEDEPSDVDVVGDKLPDKENVENSSTTQQAVSLSEEHLPSEPTVRLSEEHLPSEPNQALIESTESIQVTSSQVESVTVEPASEQEPTPLVVAQKKGTISLLESSEDEEEDDDDYLEERKGSGAEEEEDAVCPGDEEEEGEERAGPSKKAGGVSEAVDGLFMIDTRPGQEVDEQYYKDEGKGAEKEENIDEEFVDEEGDDDDDDEDSKALFFHRNAQVKELSSRIDPGIRVKELGGLYINFDGSKSKPVSSSLKKLKEQKIQDEVMKKSVIGPEFEKKDSVPPYSESKLASKLKRRAEKEKTTGDGWFNMKAPELTQELKGDLNVLKMRGTMDPKRFYKKNDRDGFPKYFQMATVVDSPVDFYHSRVPKKERKRTMVEELLADAEFRQANKKRYQQVIAEKAALSAGQRKKKKSKFQKK